MTRLKKVNYSESDISNLSLAPELMSSEDSNGICHPPSYRKPELTELFECKVDVVKLRNNDIVKQRGQKSHKNVPSCLLGNPNVIC